MAKLQITPHKAKHDFGLLTTMAEKAYEVPKEDTEEHIRKLFEDMCKRLSRQELRVECVNYHLFREIKMTEITNKTA
jgi:hypothetical protein